MIIYQATNLITGDFYIGVTKNSLAIRIRRHNSDAVSKPKQHFHFAIKKYGKENFEWKILDESAQTVEELYNLEKQLILQLKPKYNKATGGTGNPGNIPWNKGKTLPQYVKDNISKTLTGRKLTEEQKKNHVCFKEGHKQSDETKKKISKAHKGRVHTTEAKKGMGRYKKRLIHESKNHP
jgi:group I intron endonuclease